MGLRGSPPPTDLRGLRDPQGSYAGQEGQGFNIAMKTLDGGRIGIASPGSGSGRGRRWTEAIKYTKERVQFGKRISKFQNTQFKLADMQPAAGRQVAGLYAAMKKQKRALPSMYAAMAKLFAAETARWDPPAVQLFGGYGYTREYPVERMMRDCQDSPSTRALLEVQRMVISGNLGVK